MKHLFQHWWLQKNHPFPESDVLWLLFCPCYFIPTVLFLDDIFLNVAVGISFTSSSIISTPKNLSLFLNFFSWNVPNPFFLSTESWFFIEILWIVDFYGLILFVALTVFPFCSGRGAIFYPNVLVSELIYFKSLDQVLIFLTSVDLNYLHSRLCLWIENALI